MENNETDVNPKNESLALIRSALENPDIDADKLQQLLIVKKEWEADEARKSYAIALVEFQANCPTVKKSKVMRGNITFAGKADIERVIKPVLAQHGLAISILDSTIENGQLNIKGCIMHKDGHVQNLSGSVTVDKNMSANDTQKIGSAMSYAWRYMICPALNITLDDQVDDDGAGASGSLITEDQVDEIEKYLGNMDASKRKGVLKLCQCDSISEIESKWYASVIKRLKLSVK